MEDASIVGVDDVEDFLKDVIKIAMVEFVEAEGKDMLTELIRRVNSQA